MITPTLLNSLAWKGYLIFMCLNYSFIPLVVSLAEHHSDTKAATDYLQYFCYPETANLTLEEVDWLFYEGDVVRRSRRIAKEGWEVAEGAEPHPGMLEMGSVSSSKKEEENMEN